MNKQEVISKLKSAIPKNNIDDYQRGEAAGLNFALLLLAELDDPVRPPEPKPLEPEKPVVPQFVADFYESIKDDFENKVYELCLQYKHRGDELPQGVAWWFGDSRNKPIETLVMMHQLGYEVKKEKLYIAKNKQTGEYLCYCFEFFHDKNSSSENQRFTAEEKQWKELGYWGNDLYVFEEAKGEDE